MSASPCAGEHRDAKRVRARFGRAADILEEFDSWLGVESGPASAVVMANPELPAGACLFGYIDFPDDLARARALFSGMEAAALRLGGRSLAGPVDYSTWIGCKWKTAGWEERHPIPPEPANPPYMPRIAGSLGFRALHRYSSDLIPLDDPAQDEALRCAHEASLAAGYGFFDFHGPEWPRALDELFVITRDSFGEVPFYCPARRSYFRDVYLSFLDEVEPHVVVCRKDGQACGFILYYRHPRHAPWWVIPLVAVLEGHRRAGLCSALIHLARAQARSEGARSFVHHHLYEKSLCRRFSRAGRRLTEYAVFAKELGASPAQERAP